MRSKLPEISEYLVFLKRKFLRICPYNDLELGILLRQTIRRVSIISIMVIAILIVWNTIWKIGMSLYFLESIFLGLYLVAMEVPNHIVQEKEDEVYQELLIYFAKVKHLYMSYRHIPNAIYDASEQMSYEIEQYAKKMYQILMGNNRKEKVREYVLFFTGNRYLKLFLVQAYEASEKGDLLLEKEGSLFSDNIEYLRLELMEELYRRKKRAYEFAGYIFVTVTPFFMMPVLKQWGLDFAPELHVFYAGTGILIELVTFFVSIIIYGFINRAKEISLFLETSESETKQQSIFYNNMMIRKIVEALEHHDGSFSTTIRNLLLQSGAKTSYGQFIFRMITISIVSFFLLFSFMIGIQEKEKSSILETVSSIDTLLPTAKEERKQLITQYILVITKQYKNEENIVEEEIQEAFREKMYLSNKSVEQEIVATIIEKVMQYQKVKIEVWELFLCFFGSVIVGVLPLFQVWYQVQMSLAGAVYEIKQFQSILIMERRLHGITMLGMLEDMEAFSRVFKNVLRKCINSYPSGPKKALQTMKEEGKKIHNSFAELADGFLAVDEVGIAKAFAEVEHNRILLEKMSQLEAEISLEKKKDSTELLSKIPMFLAVGAYFIIPFFLFSMYGVFEVFELLEELQM